MDLKCDFCPRHCSVNRAMGERGYCGGGTLLRIAAALPHYWEEPCISGVHGSGAVFFSGCILRCEFCQNIEISRNADGGRETDAAGLQAIFYELVNKNVHNINLVTGTHFTDVIAEALRIPLPVPVVWNSGGYDSVDALRRLDGKISVYMPDFKYSDNALAAKLSGVSDYAERCTEAVTEMYRQVGAAEFDSDGLITKGVIIRHLLLPEQIQNTLGVIDRVAEIFPDGEVLFSLMSQFTPNGQCKTLSRTVTADEYESAKLQLFSSGLDGYVQELDSARDGYVPKWDLQP
ncbi:MAG: radical SAM protein [Oscillospiraceae bacterium]|nr:radical SAM protein [Oscillospiraceae bacterium]